MHDFRESPYGRSGDRPGRPFTRFVATLLLPPLILSSCYRTIPLTGPSPSPGMRIVATLSPQGTFQLTDLLGSGVVTVEGEVAEVTPQEWRLRMISAVMNDGREVGWSREQVALPVALITGAEERQLDRKKSWLSVGAVTAGAVLLGRIFLRGVFERDDPTQPPVPPA